MRRDQKIVYDPYLKFIRHKPCVVCGQPGEAHHVVARGQRESKRNDFTALPFCREHHNEFHSHGAGYFPFTDLWQEAFWLVLEFIIDQDVLKIERGKIR